MQQLRVAIIGAGFMGRAHSMAMALADVAGGVGAHIVRQVLVDATEELAATNAAELGWNESTGDWHDVVNRDDIDVIDICTPPQLHEPIAVAAMRAGKHVFCEKPITNDTAEAVRMAELANSTGIVNQVGFNYRNSPPIAYAKQLLDGGELGRPLFFRASYLQEGGFYFNDPNRWRAKRSTGGSGTVGDIGSHITDAAEFLCGDIVRVVAQVRGKVDDATGTWMTEAERLAEDELDEAGTWLAEFASGAIGSFSVSSYASGRKNRYAFELDATAGAFDFNWNNREEFRVSYVNEPPGHRGFRTIHSNNEHPDGWWRLPGLGTGYVDTSAIQFQRFFRAIVKGEKSGPDFADAAHIQGVIDAVHESVTTGGWADVPPRLP